MDRVSADRSAPPGAAGRGTSDVEPRPSAGGAPGGSAPMADAPWGLPGDLYLDLLKQCLTRRLFDRTLRPIAPYRRGLNATLKATLARAVVTPVQKLLASRRLVLARPMVLGPELFAESPPPLDVSLALGAETLIGPRGLDNLQHCIRSVVQNNVPGDLIETGVWRGGAAIFMRAALKALGDTTRLVWAADSFRGLPPADPTRRPAAAGMDWSRMDWLAVPLEEVKRNFARYGLLDDQVRFLVGWFHETLPGAPIERLAVLRLDGDMYGSTMDALRALYPKLSVGGYAIIDDYWVSECQAAVDEYRAAYGVTEELQRVDRAIVFWQRRR
jgi:O-methyltransferase